MSFAARAAAPQLRHASSQEGRVGNLKHYQSHMVLPRPHFCSRCRFGLHHREPRRHVCISLLFCGSGAHPVWRCLQPFQPALQMVRECDSSHTVLPGQLLCSRNSESLNERAGADRTHAVFGKGLRATFARLAAQRLGLPPEAPGSIPCTLLPCANQAPPASPSVGSAPAVVSVGEARKSGPQTVTAARATVRAVPSDGCRCLSSGSAS